METTQTKQPGCNIFLIGFMGAGKSTIAAELKRQLQLELIEMDQLIEEQQGMPITEIFAKYGEDHFRKLETDMLVSFQDKTNTVVSCGGGIVKKPENLRALHQNGIILFIDRPVDALAVGGGRPLSSSMDALRQMEAQRRPLYLAAADAVIPNNGTLDDALHTAMEALDEIFDS